jgi:hypothetical protein
MGPEFAILDKDGEIVRSWGTWELQHWQPGMPGQPTKYDHAVIRLDEPGIKSDQAERLKEYKLILEYYFDDQLGPKWEQEDFSFPTPIRTGATLVPINFPIPVDMDYLASFFGH